MRNNDVDIDEQGLWRLLFMSMIRLLNTVESEVKASDGLTLLDVGMLFALGHAGDGMPMGRVAALFGVDPSVVTYRLKRLEARGLAERVASADDRRITLARRTDAGRAALRAARTSMLSSAETHFFAHVEPAQMPVLTDVFEALHAAQHAALAEHREPQAG